MLASSSHGNDHDLLEEMSDLFLSYLSHNYLCYWSQNIVVIFDITTE